MAGLTSRSTATAEFVFENEHVAVSSQGGINQP